MQWKESRFRMWALAAREYNETRDINLSSLVSLATWDPDKFQDVVDEGGYAPSDEEDVDTEEIRNQAIRRAEQIRRMPGSGSKLDPKRRESSDEENGE